MGSVLGVIKGPWKRQESSSFKIHKHKEKLEKAQVKASYSGKFVVRITSFRKRLLDEDNLAVKYHVDALRYAGIIPNDAPDKTHIEVSQIKSDTNMTLIEIEAVGATMQ